MNKTNRMNRTNWPSDELLASNVDTGYLAYLRSVARPLLQFTSGHFPPDCVSAPHRHPCIVLHGCLNGPITICTPTWHRTLEAGQFYLLPPNEQHYWKSAGTDTAATIGLLIDAENPGLWPKGSGVPQCCRRLSELVKMPQFFSTAKESNLRGVFWQAADILTLERPCNPLTINSVLWLLIAMAVDDLSVNQDETDEGTESAQKIRRILLTRVYDSPSVEEIAREVGMSLTRAKNVFAATYGCGIKAYLNQLKLYQAKRLLGDTQLTVQQIGFKLGFSSPAYFCRMFREKTGHTPSEFRSLLRDEDKSQDSMPKR